MCVSMCVCVSVVRGLMERETNCVSIVQVSTTHGGPLVCILLIPPAVYSSACFLPDLRLNLCARVCVLPSREVPAS